MVDVVNDRQKVGPQATAAARRRRVAVILILIVDVGLHRVGRSGRCLAGSSARSRGQSDPAAGYEGYSGGSWSELAGYLPADRGIHDGALPDVRHLQRPVRTHGQRHRYHRLPAR